MKKKHLVPLLVLVLLIGGFAGGFIGARLSGGNSAAVAAPAAEAPTAQPEPAAQPKPAAPERTETSAAQPEPAAPKPQTEEKVIGRDYDPYEKILAYLDANGLDETGTVIPGGVYFQWWDAGCPNYEFEDDGISWDRFIRSIGYDPVNEVAVERIDPAPAASTPAASTPAASTPAAPKPAQTPTQTAAPAPMPAPADDYDPNDLEAGKNDPDYGGVPVPAEGDDRTTFDTSIRIRDVGTAPADDYDPNDLEAGLSDPDHGGPIVPAEGNDRTTFDTSIKLNP